MANNSPTIVAASLSDDQLKKSIDSLVTHVDEAMKKMVQSTNNAVGEMEAKLKSLGNVRISSGGTADGGSSRRTSAVEKETKARKELNMTLDQQASAINTAVQSEKKYTDEVLRQAAAIRSSKEWQERGHVVVGDANYYDKERANVSKRDKQLLLSLEEQIVQAQQRETDEAKKSTQAAQQQTQAAKETAQAILSVSKALGITDEQMNKSAHVYLKERGISTRNVTAPNSSVFQSYDDLRSSIAAVLKVEASQVNMLNTLNASQSQLSASLKQLQGAYNKLGRADRESEQGKNLILTIQKTQRAIQKLQSEASRPIGLGNALALSEKTLDDMAYKLRQLQSYKMGLNVKTQVDEMKQVDKEIVSLKKRYDELMGKNQQMIASNTALGRSWNYMKNRLAFYFTVGAGTSFVKNLIEVRSQYEMNERALGILINSAERGTQIFNELSQMALVSPYTLIELSTAAKQLTAYDVAAKDVVDTTRRLADMAAAVGIPIERLTYALGQIRAYGYLNARDARMFSNAGIPLVKQLSNYYTELEGRLVSTADVYDRIKKKAIDYNEVMEVINKMTDEGGKFFDFQAKMADTLKVRLANLTLAWNNMLNDMGKETQGVLTFGIGTLKELFLRWKELDSALKTIAITFGVVKSAQLLYYVAAANTNKAIALQAVLGKRLDKTLRSVGGSLKSVQGTPLTWWYLLAFAVISVGKTLWDAKKASEEFNKSIRDGATENYNNISKFLGDYKAIRDGLYKYDNNNIATPVDIESGEAKKVWESVREQIELTSQASGEYIGKLLTISNISERVRQGFNILEDIQAVSAALKEVSDDTFNVTQSYSSWWNAWTLPDGLIQNIKDYTEAINGAEQKTIRFASAVGGQAFEVTTTAAENARPHLEVLKKDVDSLTESIISFISLKGWSGDVNKITEVFAQITKKIATENQLNPQEAFELQLQVEDARSKAAKQALQQRIKDEEASLKISNDERVRQALESDKQELANWDNFNGRKKVEWERFTKWLKEQHISETTAMFRNMDAEDIRSLNFQEGKHADWVKRMVTQYAKEHKMSYDDAFKYLKNWVRSANQWSIFIPLTISTEDKKSVYDQLGEYDKAIDDADAQIARLTTRINELNAKKKKSKEETKELADAERELTQAQKDKADAEAKGGHGKKEKKDEKAANKAAKQAESELQKALKDELSTIEKVRSIYKDLTKEGMSHANAVERATRGWDETVNAINRVLQKNGLQKLDLSKFAGIENPRELVNMLQSQLNTLLKRGAKPAEIKELQTKVNTLEVDADKYDLTKITKGLNNELGKLKDEYELAVELDADPELGNAFANMMGIDIESLPHTVKEYADRYSTYLNKYLKGKDSSLQFTGDELRGLTRDDITAFREQVDAGSFNQEWFDAILKAYEDISGKRKKDLEETEKWKNSLIEKYGNLQDKLTKIYKDSVQNQVNAVKSFGTEDQKSDIVRLQLRLEATDNPAELTEINTEIAKIVKDVTDKNPIALKLVTASDNQTKADTSKTYWEDFKNSELYAMTFEDMANNSTRAIQLIMDKLEGLKDKVKEDPASMKALMKSLEDAQKELNARDPFGGIARSLREMSAASQETKAAQEALWRAEVDVEQAQQKVDNSEDGTPEEQAAAQQKLADAIQRRAAAQVKLTQAENNGKKAQENLKSSLQGISNQLGNVQELFGVVSKLFRAGGDDETADAIDAISEGFSIMTTVIMGVVAAMILLESSQPWLLAIAAALSVIVGLVSFLSGNENKKIDAKIKDSELAVKRLENAYKNLEFAIENAYGANVIGAKQAAVANKELQLAELRRQLSLEKSRDSKHRDEEKIVQLEGQIVDLQNDIKRSAQEVATELLGISSVGDAALSFMDAYISALRKGEDAQSAFTGSWKEMIANMIKQLWVTKVIGPQLEELVDEMNERLKSRSKVEAKAYANAVNELTRRQTMSDDDIRRELIQGEYNRWRDEELFPNGGWNTVLMAEKWRQLWNSVTQEQIDAYKEDAEKNVKNAQRDLNKVTTPTIEDLSLVADAGESLIPMLEASNGAINAMLERFGLLDDTESNLSALQQGLQGVSEETAGSVEAYLNGMSQQAYLRNDLLTQIRDTIMSFDMDVQLGVFSQMLLQLQNNYIVMQSMQSMMENWTVPSGSGIRVELMS